MACHTEDKKDAVPYAGGRELKTPFGKFYGPNITPDPEAGIGKWTETDFVRAMRHGERPDGANYFPAFPYPSFTRISDADLRDLWAYLRSLPPGKRASQPHELRFPFGWRALVAGWKWLYFTPGTGAGAPAAPATARGEYLVQALGHCGECHTPRNIFMVRDDTRAFAGGPHPEGEGRVPSLRGLIERQRYKDAQDLVSAMQFGETYGYDKLSSGGMGAVQANLAKLPDADVQAIAEYLVSLK